LADTHGSHWCHHTEKEWPNTHTHVYTRTTKKSKKKKTKRRRRKKEEKERENEKLIQKFGGRVQRSLGKEEGRTSYQ